MAVFVPGTPFGGAFGNAASPGYTGVFIPQIWSGKLTEKFYQATVLAAIANTDYEGEIKNMGDTVKIRQRPTVQIENYVPDIELNMRRPSVALANTLEINKGKYFNLALDDVMEIQADIDMMSIWAEDASEQMKITVDTDVLADMVVGGVVGALIPATTSGLTAGAITASIRLGTAAAPHFVGPVGAGTKDGALVGDSMPVINWLVNMGQVLDEGNIPESGRWVIIPAWVAAAIKKSDLKDASLSGDGTSMLRNGRLGMIDRFTLYMSNLLFNTGGAYTVIFGTRAGLTFASQFTKMETLRSERSFANLLRGLQVYGYQIAAPTALGRSVIKVGA